MVVFILNQKEVNAYLFLYFIAGCFDAVSKKKRRGLFPLLSLVHCLISHVSVLISAEIVTVCTTTLVFLHSIEVFFEYGFEILVFFVASMCIHRHPVPIQGHERCHNSHHNNMGSQPVSESQKNGIENEVEEEEFVTKITGQHKCIHGTS